MANDVDVLVEAINRELPPEWAAWPGGWADAAELALLDAVFSIRAVYGGPQSGVRAGVRRWRERPGGTDVDDLRHFHDWDPQELADLVGNHQRTAGRLKTEAVIDAADRLVQAGLVTSGDLDPESEDQKRAWTATRGLGPVTWSYFCMLLGKPDVKADRWIIAFVEQVLRSSRTPKECQALVRAAAERLLVDATHLDHAIWSHARSRGLATT